MNVTFEDTLEPFGIALGALLVLIGLATLAGTPWTHKSGSAVVMVGQLIGALAAVGIGAGLAWIAHTQG